MKIDVGVWISTAVISHNIIIINIRYTSRLYLYKIKYNIWCNLKYISIPLIMLGNVNYIIILINWQNTWSRYLLLKKYFNKLNFNIVFNTNLQN